MKRKSIRNKILVSIIGITLMTSAAIACMFYIRSARMIEQNYMTELGRRIRQMTETIDRDMMNMCDTGIKASGDRELKELVVKYGEENNDKELERLSEKMRVFAGTDRNISSVYFIMPETGKIVTTLDYPVYKTDVPKNEMYRFVRRIEENKGPVVVEDLIHSGEKIVTMAESVADAGGKFLGYLCVNISESRMSYSYFSDSVTREIVQISLISENQVAASSSLSVIGTEFDRDQYGKKMDSTEAVWRDKKFIYIYCEGAFSHSGIFAVVKRNALLSDLLWIKKYIVCITAVFAAAALGAAFYITRIVYRPILKLMSAMKQVSDGNMDTRAEVVTQDEIGLAAIEMNKMLDQIQELIRQLIEEEHKKKDAELEALQYQITPHFMYNTLNSVKCLAYIKGQKEIAEVIDDFVELLQTCIRKKGAFMTVSEEIHLLGQYIRLNEFRSGEKYRTEFFIEEEASQCLIPRLILQPLAENAVLHGLDMKEGRNCIRVRAFVKDGRLYLEVSDNGRGMSESKIREIMNEKEEKTRGMTAVGIPNIRERLKLYYADQAELSFVCEGEGTTATIYMPARKSEE